MNNIAIKVENLGKKYIIQHEKKESYKTFQDVLMNGGKKIITSLNPFSQSEQRIDETEEEFWALKDVNFEINKGDKVGIIGRNGAGKSTLLKILSRITEPTTGKIHINGRIASLLEVGTGFHPELTGRENIYLNGAILGMSRKEIKSKFDEIVAFAEVEKFLDTPVKRYSSGMYVRLAFAVAAHLEPEILVVDEVLAVGDVEFQKKCLGKMGEVSKEGRTILFVSHNMNAIEQLCNHIILIDNGKLIQKDNNVRDVLHYYLTDKNNSIKQNYWVNKMTKYNNPYFKPRYFAVCNQNNEPITKDVKNDEKVKVVIEGDIKELDKSLQVGFSLFDEENNLVFISTINDDEEQYWPEIKIGINKFSTYIPSRLLNEGVYRLEIIVTLYNRSWIIEPSKNAPYIFFSIRGGLSKSPYWTIRRPGQIAPELKWKTELNQYNEMDLHGK